MSCRTAFKTLSNKAWSLLKEVAKGLQAILFLALGLSIIAGCSEPPAEHEHSLAKNVILFIGDGMGVSTVTAARIFDGQSMGLNGEEHALSFEQFPYLALVKTYNTNQQVPDSAGTATAMVSGSKTRAGVINVGPEALRGDCRSSGAHQLKSIGRIAKEKGKAVGLVTTTTVTHATPASVYAVSPERNWESDAYMPANALEEGCLDIARQLFNKESNMVIDLVLGGGRSMFFSSAEEGVRGSPSLVQPWLDAAVDRQFIETGSQLDSIQNADQVLGLFAPSHMSYVAERAPNSGEPKLSEMTSAAISYLEGRSSGYFLMVEGGRIDHGHHQNKAGYAMLETQEFSRAIAAALELVNSEETLILVTADHSHVMAIAGYPTRGNDILGYVIGNDQHGNPKSEPELDAGGIPYTTLGYINGPGAVSDLPRPRPETGLRATAQALVPTGYRISEETFYPNETHAGEDVPLYAIGPGSYRVKGVIEQNKIFDIMLKAYGWE